MTQTLIRIGLALVVLLAVAGAVGIASAEMTAGVDDPDNHSEHQVNDRMGEHHDRHAANTDRDAGEQHHGHHMSDERHSQHADGDRHGHHMSDERHSQHADGDRHGQHGPASGPASGR